MKLSEMLMQCFIKVGIFSRVMFLFKLKSLGENRQAKWQHENKHSSYKKEITEMRMKKAC